MASYSLAYIYCLLFLFDVSSRGFLKGDKSLGQAAVKLASFENRCEIHECVDVSHDIFTWLS